MFNITQRLSWFPSLATAAILGLMTLLSGCGGGGASSELDLPMTVVPASAVVYAYADTPTVLTIRDGKKPFNVYSSNPAIITFNPATMPQGLVPDEFITLEGPTGAYGRVNNVDVDTLVTLTIRDAEGTQFNVVVTVKPSSLNTTLTITGADSGGTCTGGENQICSGTQGTASVRATTITGAPVIGRQITFRVTDQGAAWQFVCNVTLGDCTPTTDASGRVIALTTTTDRNGDAFAVMRADVNAPTQFATISATDLVSGHQLRKQFVISGAALAALPASATWNIGTGNGDLVFDANGVDNIAGNADDETSGGCDPVPANGNTGATTGFYVYGGTPPYTITSTTPSVGSLSATSTGTYGATTTVATSGSQFFARAMCTAEGTTNIVITDSVGAILSTVTFVVDIKF
ncbi:MAG: hypothetical protein KKH74_00625 [Gammaproteobacteria bacterium]|nr:hypothetical protein [Gammaproteobacteria bacterium]MBU1732172.1 hypothetical protein [Gammaproteobacteria bacterium]MBU1893298.1 hypothetical protein [Gammaproteobacteria bacterium]